MARNAEGNVEGDELQFDRKQLQQFSTSLSTFAKTGLISEKAGSQSALITLPFFNDLEAAVKALEDLADY